MIISPRKSSMEVTISLSLHCRLDFKTEAEPGFIVSGRLINSAKQFFTKQEKKYLDNEMLEWLMMEKKNDYSSKTTDNGTRSGYLPQN